VVAIAGWNGHAPVDAAAAAETLPILSARASELRDVAMRFRDRARQNLRRVYVFGLRQADRRGPRSLPNSRRAPMNLKSHHRRFEVCRSFRRDIVRAVNAGLYNYCGPELAKARVTAAVMKSRPEADPALIKRMLEAIWNADD